MFNLYKIGEKELRLKPLQPLIFTRFGVEFDKTHRPEVPVAEVTYAGNKKGIRYDTKDPAYASLVSDYETAKFQATIEFCIKYCVVDEPPVDFVVDEELGENTLANRKVIWVLGLMDNVDQTADFLSACLGQNAPVEEEINRLAGEFKSDD